MFIPIPLHGPAEMWFVGMRSFVLLFLLQSSEENAIEIRVGESFFQNLLKQKIKGIVYIVSLQKVRDFARKNKREKIFMLS
jgi:hypothetical protein